MEIPLVMRVLNRKGAEFKELVSKVLTFDYLGALAVSLLFPLLLAPKLGMARSALLFGILNAAVAYLTARVFKAELPRYRAIRLCALIVLFVFAAAFAYADRISFKAEQSYFGDPRRLSKPLALPAARRDSLERRHPPLHQRQLVILLPFSAR